MRCHRLYLIPDFKNFSPDTLKIADILRYGLHLLHITFSKKEESFDKSI